MVRRGLLAPAKYLLPHRYYGRHEGEENWRTPFGMRRRIPEGAYIHASVQQRMEEPKFDYRPKNLLGGAAALEPHHNHGQQCGTVFLYKPVGDAKPFLNKAAVRIGVMVLVSALDLAALALLPAAAWYLWHRSRS